MNKINEVEQYYALLEQKRTELRAISYYKDKMQRVRSKVDEEAEVSNLEDFLDFCEKWNSKSNIYAGIHERVKGGTASRDVSCVKIIAVDVDSIHPKNQAATEEELRKCKEEGFLMLEELAQQYGRPSVLMSGNGYQFLWKIRQIDITNKNRDKIEGKVKKWIANLQKKYNSDSMHIDQIGDLARILKVAGTMSIKGENTQERPHRESYFVEYNLNITENLRDEILTIELTESAVKQPEIKPKDSSVGKFDYLLTRDSKLSSLYHGNISGYASRSEAEQALVFKLVYYEFSDFEIDLIMRNSAIGKWPTTSKEYKELTISKARLMVRQKIDDLKDIKLEDVYNVLSKWLYLPDFKMVDLILATILSQKLTGSPVWIIFVGASGDGKSELARTIEDMDFIYKIDQITPNTIVSGNPKIEDLAPRLDNKVLLIPDFASLLSLNSDAQRSIFAQLRSLYDGEAYKDSGAGARKHYTGLRVTLIANSTPLINHKILIHQELGTRELIYRTDYNSTQEDIEKKSLRALENEGRKVEMRSEIKSVVSAFLNKRSIKKIELYPDVKDWLYSKARWLSTMRATTMTDTYTGELISDVAPEVPTRLLMQLKVIYICLKSLDNNYPDDRVKEIILRIINSSARSIRVKIYQYLESCSERVTASAISEALRIGKKTVFTECNILWNLNLITCEKLRTIQFGRETEITHWYLDEKPTKEEEV